MHRLLLAAALFAAPLVLADEQDDTEREVEEAVRLLQQGEMKPADLEALGKQIVERMAVIRQLPIKGKVQMEVATREQIVSYVDSRIQEEMKGDALVGQEAALKRLGLVPENLDMKKFLLDLYGEQVAGYYDPFKQKFFIASWMQPAMQAPIMAHELTHALQDQHFNLKPFLTPLPDNSDATSARQAVVEGDAVIAMFGYIGMQVSDRIGPTLRSSMASPAYPIFQGAPAYFQEALFFPYADGADFIVEVQKKGGWKQVSALYADLPKSSEQILHPEKYLGTKDEPTPVDIPMTLTGWKEAHNDVLGEIVLRVMLEGFVDDAEAKKAAAGWDGDRYRAFQKNGSRAGWKSTMIVHRSTWDSANDAKEFADVLKKALPRKYEGATTKSAKGATTFATISEGIARVEVRDKDVVWVDGAPDADLAGKVASLAWGSK